MIELTTFSLLLFPSLPKPPDNGPPPLPSSSLPEGYYEEAVPLGPGKAPEYITSNYDSDAMSSSYESYDEEEEDGKGQKMRHQWPSEEASMDLVKDARICAFLLRKKRFGQWTKLLCVIKDNKLLCYKSSKDQTPQMELLLSGCSITHIPKDGKKKKHELKIVHQGADALVLAVQSKEQAEEWLKFSPCSSSVLILWTGLGKFHLLSFFFFFPSFFFLLSFLSSDSPLPWAGMVMKEVCSNGNGVVDCDGAGSGSPVHKAELEKVCETVWRFACLPASPHLSTLHRRLLSVFLHSGSAARAWRAIKAAYAYQIPSCHGCVLLASCKCICNLTLVLQKLSCDRPSSDGEPCHENGISDGKDPAKGKKNSKSEQKGTVGRYLNVLSNNRWRERWCQLKDNQLLLHKDRADLKTHMASLPLRGCEVIPGLDSKHPFAFRLLRNGQEVAVLEASSSESMGRWLGVLLAETGSTTDPAALHYDYIDVETTANVIQLAKQSFCFTSKRAVSPNPYLDNPVNGYACPTGVALHYDDVPCINGSVPDAHYSSPASGGRRWKEESHYENTDLYENMPSPKLAARYSPKSIRSQSSSTGHYNTPLSTKSLSSSSAANTNTNQFKGKKGLTTNGFTSKQKLDKNQPKKANGISSTIPVKQNNSSKRSQASLTERLKKVEDECKLKEEERVNLELELTEVKESLKKALNGGVTLGLTIEPKTGSSSPQSPVLMRRTVDNSPISSCDTSDTETCSLPVNSASLLRRQTQQKASPVRGHVLRKAKEWEMKSGT
ncbi:Actin filament-associated protein 1 [Labeo rohita]|uniref:Actin filament-associated protein 1 n=1 Tax=Labeo rohita TaxID=84645 RepID=A0ABQ8M6E5_LABRO|nr:Actin filament-associated protein 1 [Labeo rohita]